jgi:hypothetical protein
VLSTSAQFYPTTYNDSLHTRGQTNTYTLSAGLPIQFKSGHTLIIKANGERIHSEYNSDVVYRYDLYSLSLPVGMQFKLNDEWKLLTMVIPKVASDMQDDPGKNAQLGGTALFTYVKNEKLKFRFGLYYNSECFGNFFVPLAGMDWKVNERWFFYGTLPNNYRIEYRCGGKLFSGIGFRSFQRSYRLSGVYHHDYVRVKENELKLFTDYFIYKDLLVFAEVSYAINYNLLEHPDEVEFASSSPIYTPLKPGFLFSVGLAWRIRKE